MDHQKECFNKWLHGLDGEGAFSLRIERYLDDVEAGQFSQAIKWLEAAFNEGYEAGYELGKERGRDQAEDFYNLRN